MLLNNFYTITGLAQEENRLQASICINPAHDIFKGHFPNQPVVPGVCMVQIIKELLEKATGKSLLFSKGSQLKFLRLLVPAAEETVQVNISWNQEETGYLTQADFKKDTEAIFKLSGLFTADQHTA